jgi:hypothetical protein
MTSLLSKYAFRSLYAVTALAVSVGLAGCKSDSKPATMDDGFDKPICSLPKPCQDIVKYCHPKDDGTPGTPVNECHEVAHDQGTLEGCVEVHDDCVAKCQAAPALSDGPVEDPTAHCHNDAGGVSQKDGG